MQLIWSLKSSVNGQGISVTFINHGFVARHFSFKLPRSSLSVERSILCHFGSQILHLQSAELYIMFLVMHGDDCVAGVAV